MNRIKELRTLHHMTQIRLSIELGVSQESVSAFEKGKYNPSYQNLLKMSEIFNTSIDYIMGHSDVPIDRSELSDMEEQMIALFRSLNEVKKEKALAYIQGLTE